MPFHRLQYGLILTATQPRFHFVPASVGFSFISKYLRADGPILGSGSFTGGNGISVPILVVFANPIPGFFCLFSFSYFLVIPLQTYWIQVNSSNARSMWTGFNTNVYFDGPAWSDGAPSTSYD